MSQFLTQDALTAELRSLLERGLREVVSFQSLEIHPPAVGSEPFFDGRSLSFPLKRADEDIALVVLAGVERPPEPETLLAVCAELIGDSRPGPSAEPEQGRAREVTAAESYAGPADGALEAFRASLVRKSAGWERFAVLLAQVEGSQTMRTRFGSQRFETLLAEMSAALLEFGGPGSLVSQDGSELLLAGFPSKRAGEALAAHGRLSELAAELAGVVSAGCADYPAWGYSRPEVVDNAGKALEHARLLGPGKTAAFNAVSLNVSADALYAKGDLSAAAREYLRALEIDPEDTNVLNSLGVCHAELGEVEEAAAWFREAVALRPGEVMAHYNLGSLHLKRGDREQALECFQAAAAADSASVEARFQLGKLLLEAGRAAEAKEHLLAAEALERCSYVHRHLGDCLLQLGESAEAAAHYKRAVRANPEDAHSLSQLAAIYLEMGSDLEVALSLLKKSVELEPECRLHRERLQAALARLPGGLPD